jgi:hypothetical protein
VTISRKRASFGTLSEIASHQVLPSQAGRAKRRARS